MSFNKWISPDGNTNLCKHKIDMCVYTCNVIIFDHKSLSDFLSNVDGNENSVNVVCEWVTLILKPKYMMPWWYWRWWWWSSLKWWWKINDCDNDYDDDDDDGVVVITPKGPRKPRPPRTPTHALLLRPRKHQQAKLARDPFVEGGRYKKNVFFMISWLKAFGKEKKIPLIIIEFWSKFI